MERKRPAGDEVSNDCADEKVMKMDAVPQGILLGYGNPLLDLSVQGTADYLQKYGLKDNDAILAEDKHIPMYKEMQEVFKDNIDYVAGGATLNSIRVAQWVLQTPHTTSFMGCIAKDEFGDLLTQAATSAGVDVKFQYTDKQPTGTCAVLCTEKNRSLVAHLAAANCFTESHLDDKDVWGAVEKAQYYYFGGYPLTVCPPAMIRVAKYACDNNRTVLMNMSAPFLCTFFKEPMLQMLVYADYWFGNETEAVDFSKANNLETEDIKEIALKIANWEKVNKKRSRIVVITQGPDPSIVVVDGKVQEYPVIPIKSDDIVDSNAAGDAFVGGFLAGLVKDKSLEDCMRCGHYTANHILHTTGCTLLDKPNPPC